MWNCIQTNTLLKKLSIGGGGPLIFLFSVLFFYFPPKKEIRDQMRGLSAGDTAHTGGEEGAGLRLPPALLRLHRVQEAAGHGRRVLSDGGQQAGV